MPSALHALFCGLTATLLWTCIGLPLASRVVPRSMALPVAPLLGWAVHSTLALAGLLFIGFSSLTVVALTGVALLVSIAVLSGRLITPEFGQDGVSVPAWAYGGALLLAIAPAIAIMPKLIDGAVAFSAPVFDHSKVATLGEGVNDHRVIVGSFAPKGSTNLTGFAATY